MFSIFHPLLSVSDSAQRHRLCDRSCFQPCLWLDCQSHMRWEGGEWGRQKHTKCTSMSPCHVCTVASSTAFCLAWMHLEICFSCPLNLFPFVLSTSYCFPILLVAYYHEVSVFSSAILSLFSTCSIYNGFSLCTFFFSTLHLKRNLIMAHLLSLFNVSPRLFSDRSLT